MARCAVRDALFRVAIPLSVCCTKHLVISQHLRQQSSMSSVAHVTIHPSQFPDAVRRDLLASLRDRQVNHKFHYDSIKQTQKWLAIHQAYFALAH